MSKHWAWFPPEVHINTGRLCSAGSGCHPVPRLHRSYAALRLPAPFGHGSGSPCRRPTSVRTLVLCPLGRRHVRPHTRRASETGHRLSAKPEFVEERRGPPRLLGRPLRACHGRTPRRIRPLLARLRRGRCCLQVKSSTLGIREDYRFRGRSPTAHTFACLRIAEPFSDDRRKAGYRLGRAHPWPGGIRTRWTTDKISWSHRILQSPLTSIAWSH